MKQTLARFSLFVTAVSLVAALSAAYLPATASATAPLGGRVTDGTDTPSTDDGCAADGAGCGDPALKCVPGGSNAGDCDLYRKYINPIIWFLSALVGLAVTIGIIMGGIRYAASGGDPSQAANAKNQIKNAVIAMVVFLFLLAALNWLIPGGLR